MENELKKHILESLKQDIRVDGRKCNDLREIVVETDVSSTAEGSARVKIGTTEVMAGVKLGIGTPFPDRPDEGAIMMNVELLPLSSPEFESGPPGMQAIELARVVDRGIRESKAIDLKKLSIKKGEKCWIVQVDICSINDSGNLLDASALAVLAALKNTVFPKYENDEINYKEKSDKKLELNKVPITVTVFKLGDVFLVDPLPNEENNFDARLSVAMTEDNKICALQKGGFSPLVSDEIIKMIEIAEEKSKELRKFL
ncbi:MAG: exosome complex protein Rrp42 [Candidatus Woesearchaeota archaeon]